MAHPAMKGFKHPNPSMPPISWLGEVPIIIAIVQAEASGHRA